MDVFTELLARERQADLRRAADRARAVRAASSPRTRRLRWPVRVPAPAPIGGCRPRPAA